MTRQLAAIAVLCLGAMGCLDPQAEEPPVAEVAETAKPTPPPAPTKTPKQVEEASVVGEKVTNLADEWFQGEAGVKGTQLVVFFETWCPHCQREAPKMQAMQERLGEKGLQVVALTRLSRGGTPEALATWADTNGLAYPIGRAKPELASQLKVRGIPAAVVLRDGEVVWRGHPGRLDDAAMSQWL